MNCTQLTPCKTCPYRRDVPPGTWHKSEFENLLEQDKSQWGNTFGCHQTAKLPKEEQYLCAGWVLDQLRRGLPNLNLRMLAIQHQDISDYLGKVNDGGFPIYKSIEEMSAVNIPLKRPVRTRKRKK